MRINLQQLHLKKEIFFMKKKQYYKVAHYKSNNFIIHSTDEIDISKKTKCI